MTEPTSDRRQAILALAGAGFSLMGNSTSVSASLEPLTDQRPRQALPRLRHSMQQCRFGAIHYHYVKPAAKTKVTPVMCLHASPASAIGFSDFLRELGTDRLVLAADNPGFGLSDRPSTPSTIADFSGAMWDLADALRIRQVDLVGSNTGSCTAVEMARQRPKAVRRIVLHSAPLFTPEEIASIETRLSGTVPPDVDSAVVKLPERWKKFAPYRQGLSDEVAWQLFWEMNRDPTHSGWGHDAAFAYAFGENLRQLRQPVLILNTKDDMSGVTSRARGMAPNIRVMDLPSSGYLFTVHAEATAKLVRAHFHG